MPAFHGPTREEEALAEIALTRVAPASAASLAAAFLLLLLTGSGLEIAAARGGRPNLLRGEDALDLPAPGEVFAIWRKHGPLVAAERLRDAGTAAQDRLDRDSRLAAAIRPRLQAALTRHLGYGTSQVLVGEEDGLYFRDDFDHLTGPPFLASAALARRRDGLGRHPAPAPDPLPAIVGLAADLRARGVALVLVPVPTKLGVAWERFLGVPQTDGPALANPSTADLVQRLRAADVELFDPAAVLRGLEVARERPPYMRFDSHWSPAGMEATARALAEYLRTRHGVGGEASFRRVPRAFERRADLADLLGLDPGANPYLHETLEIQTIDGPDDRPYSSRRQHGPVLLVGDSFSRLLIRNRRKGGDANFAAALAFQLGTPVAMLAENDAGHDFARRVTWLEEPGVLDGRQVVVFEVAERAFSLGDWEPRRFSSPVVN
jgi:hypothetical protein